ncbi:hypothetical protein VCHENC02_3996A, partial [Vibrio harveyi]
MRVFYSLSFLYPSNLEMLGSL